MLREGCRCCRWDRSRQGRRNTCHMELRYRSQRRCSPIASPQTGYISGAGDFKDPCAPLAFAAAANGPVRSPSGNNFNTRTGSSELVVAAIRGAAGRGGGKVICFSNRTRGVYGLRGCAGADSQPGPERSGVRLTAAVPCCSSRILEERFKRHGSGASLRRA